ncbi:MAG TPA: HDIG domain-containing protein [Phycisphaerae bacterium]|nr:HDIG domain-containing protein [Phycisphaerae bacterium]
MSIFRKTTKQRREVRKGKSSQPAWYVRYYRRPGSVVSTAILILFFIVLAALDSWPENELAEYHVGQYMPSDITARQSFRVLLPAKQEELRRMAENDEPATFRLNMTVLDKIVAEVEKIPVKLSTAKSIADLTPELRDELGLELPVEKRSETDEVDNAPHADIAVVASAAMPAAASQPVVVVPFSAAPTTAIAAASQPAASASQPAVVATAVKITASQKLFDAWCGLTLTPEKKASFEKAVNFMRSVLMQTYIVDTPQAQYQQSRGAIYVKMTEDEGKTTVTQKVVDLIGLDEKDKINQRIKLAVRQFPVSVRSSAESFLRSRLDTPLFDYDAAASESAIVAAGQAVMQNPPDECYRPYARGEIVVPRTTDDSETSKGIQPHQLACLEAENRIYVSHHEAGMVFNLISRMVLFGLLVALVGWYIQNYRDELLIRHGRSLAIAVILLMMIFVAKLQIYAGLPTSSLLLPIVIVTLILTIAFDQRFAMTLGSIVVAFVVILAHVGMGFFSIFIAVMLVICLQIEQIHHVRTRSRIPVISVIAAIVAMVMILALCVWNNVPMRFVLWYVLWGVGGIIVGGLIVQGLLPLIERIFGVATGSTLLEWCDASKPLLKRLAVEATGTYNHSLQVGAMCEAAAEAIGAQGLLARVGAYYHDIGKINKPQYFSENQASGENKHEKLQPAMSQLIIQGHVKDGLELAREYGLPAALREFIASHHGTTLVQYFYQAAARRSEEGNVPKPEEHQFRYPGPKPQSCEVAILMLADAAESSVRALTEPTPTRIAQQVHKIVASRLEDGQLDECDITLKEVHKIEESLTRSLCGMYHSRIPYPEDDRKKPDQPAAKSEHKPNSHQHDGEKQNGSMPPQ